MGNLLQLISATLIKELRRHCLGYRIDWRKLIFVIAIMTTAGVLLQMFILPYPLNDWFLAPPISLSSYKASYSTMQEKVSLDTVEQFPPLELSVSANSITESKPVVEERAKTTRRRRRRRRVKKREPPEQPIVPPPPPRVVTSWHRYIWSLPPHEALVYAKKEIENVSIATDDPDLYAPLFRNVTIFRRSYELMENILKIYIYPGGDRPIFHQPLLSGIYASEGWFMKTIEENRQFITRDPEKAHLFYLPYSARQLELALYVPDSHNIKPLSIFLRDYINALSAKYPFWNRTRGRDHFLVACHDWGPYTLTEHEELTKNTIKALCNADSSEGIFTAGQDVSLPETTIRNPRRPLRDVGGRRVSQRPILAFFAGNMHGRVRPKLLDVWHNKDEDMRIYGPLPVRISRKMTYAQHMKQSKFCICPMGHEVNSPRIVEAFFYECVPVIIADNFVLPFSEVLDWSAFSVVVAEKDIPKLKDILSAIPLRRYLVMQTNVKMVQKHFLWNPRPLKYDIFHMILHSIWYSRINHIQVEEQ